MDGPDETKGYKDPLMDRVRSQTRSSRGSQSNVDQGKKNYWTILFVIKFGISFAVLGYFLYQSQQQLTLLSTRLESSQEDLVTVTEQLKHSEGRINDLQTGLSKSESQLGAQNQQLNRYQNLYSNLRRNQAKQTKNLEALAIKKADQAEVGALSDELKETTAGLKGDVNAVNSRIDETEGNVSELRGVADSNRAGIDSNSESLGSLRSTVAANTEQIVSVKHSLDRDYYNFELQRRGSAMKVFNISLKLRNTDFKRQRYHVEIVADGRRINKKRVNINEPIFFYVEGTQKPYEVLVKRVDKKYVVGYLSVPKS